MPHADRCCGSAGVYGLTQGDMSLRLLDEKMHEIRSTGAEVITPRIQAAWCSSRRASAYAESIAALHVVELLDEAYRGSPA
jgi:glycolate oxidase iron-sulfur subunit